jgi:cell division protein FtsA
MKVNPHPVQYTMAVDIGTTKIAVMVGKNADGHKNVVAQHVVKSAGVRGGVIQNIDETMRWLKQCVDAVKKQLHKLGIDYELLRRVNVGIAGSHIECMNQMHSRVRKHRGRITANEIETMTQEVSAMPQKEGRYVLHVIPYNYRIDNMAVAAKDVVGSTASAIIANYHVITADTEVIGKIVHCLNRCGLQVNQIVLEQLASAEAVLTSDEMQMGVALVDIGGGTSDMVIYQQNEIAALQMLPYGGELLTSDIAALCNITHAQANTLKEESGYCGDCPARLRDKVWTFPADDGYDNPREITIESLSQIIRKRMEEIIEVIEYHIVNSGCDINKIVLTGGCSELRTLADYTKFRTGCEVRIGRPYVQTKDDAIKKVHSKYATCIGLTFYENRSQQLKQKMSFMDMMHELFEKFKIGMVKTFFNPIDEAMEREMID